MRVVDFSKQSNQVSDKQLEEQMYSIWVSGSIADNDLQAEEVLASQLGKSLDNRYTLVRAIELPGMEITVPFILVGPTGVQVINASGLSGIYRARQDSWDEMSDDGQKFTPSRPNIIARTLLMAQLVEDYLANEELLVVSTDPILYFFQPGIDVETDQPAVRIVLTDNVGNFINELVQRPEALNSSQINQVLEALEKTSPDQSRVRHFEPSEKKQQRLIGFGKFRLLPWQWLILGIMLLIQILLVIAFVYIVRMTY